MSRPEELVVLKLANGNEITLRKMTESERKLRGAPVYPAITASFGGSGELDLELRDFSEPLTRKVKVNIRLQDEDDKV